MDDYENNATEEEYYHAYFRRQPEHYFYQLLKPLADTSTLTPSDYIDWGHSSDFVVETEVGECAGVIIDLVSTLLFETQNPVGQKATEALQQAKNMAERSLEAKKSFLSNMSHEIRTPMNGVIGMIDLLNNTPLGAEQQQYVSTIKKSSETLLNILNDILDLSKIEAGKMELRFAPISLHQTLDKLDALFSQQAQARDTLLRFSVHRDVPPYIMADETRLLQVLSNFTSNAIKFTEGGKIDIMVSVLKVRGPQLYQIKVEVRDTGIGISGKDLAVLFKQFSQVDNSYTKSYGGTGLGLAISKQLCQMMGGDVGVESVLGKGSTFWFTLSAKACTEESFERVAARSQKEDVIRVLENSPRILVVDDNEVNLMVAKNILEKAGCQVKTANNGPKAVEMAIKDPFDLVLMDIQMPGMNGITATQEISMRLPQRPPIVAMTAFSLQEEKSEFLGAGMDDYISKPIKAANLLTVVAKWTAASTAKSTAVPPGGQALPPQTVPGGLPDFDRQVPEELAKYGGMDMVRASLREFEENTAILIDELEQAAAAGDSNAWLAVMHTLKGNSGTFGAVKMYELTKNCERLLRDKEDIDMDLNLSYLKQNFEHFKTAYKSWLAEAGEQP